MSDGGKGSAPRPKSVELTQFDNNWDQIFGKDKIMKAKVSGVPYEVDLPTQEFKSTDYMSDNELVLTLDDMIATLEQENKYMRARMERLERELAEANELLTKLNIQLLNLRNASRND